MLNLLHRIVRVHSIDSSLAPAFLAGQCLQDAAAALADDDCPRSTRYPALALDQLIGRQNPAAGRQSHRQKLSEGRRSSKTEAALDELVCMDAGVALLQEVPVNGWRQLALIEDEVAVTPHEPWLPWPLSACN